MNCKKMNVMVLLVFLLAAFFIGCQIDPLTPGGGNGNNGGGDETDDIVIIVDPTGDQIAATLINKTGTLIAEVSYIENVQTAGEQRKVLSKPVAAGKKFQLAIKPGNYSFVTFPTANSQGVQPTGMAYGVTVAAGATIELVPFKEDPVDPTNDITITFNNKTGTTLDSVYWRKTSEPNAAFVKVAIQPAAAPNSSFQLPFPNGVYDLDFCSESTGSKVVVVALKSVALSAQSHNIDVVATSNPAEQCIDFVNLYKEFTTVEYRFPGQPAWGTMIPDPTGQGQQSLAIGKSLSIPFAEGTIFDMRFTTASGEAVTLLNITTVYRYGYINITGPGTGSVAKEFGKISRQVTLVNTTGETLTDYFIVDQLNMNQPQPQPQQLTPPLAPGQNTTITVLEGIYSFQFMAGYSSAGMTDATTVTSDVTIDIYQPPLMPGSR